MTIEKAAALDHLKQLVEIGAEMDLCLADLIPVLAGAPDLFAPPRPDSEEELKKTVGEAFGKAADALEKMRKTEGKAMAKDFQKILGVVRADVKELATLAESWPKTAFKRIQDRLEGIFEGSGKDLDQNRLEAEVALLVDKADINEEITRLESHCSQMESLTEAKGPVGRQSEFLIQEISREINTVASKAALTEIRSLAVKIKTELEKIRELVQNIE